MVFYPASPPPMHESRRRVSQFFLRLRALCEKGMLDRDLVAATRGHEAVQVFLLYIDPLDEALRQSENKEHKTTEREYFRSYLREFFPDAHDRTRGDCVSGSAVSPGARPLRLRGESTIVQPAGQPSFAGTKVSSPHRHP